VSRVSRISRLCHLLGLRGNRGGFGTMPGLSGVDRAEFGMPNVGVSVGFHARGRLLIKVNEQHLPTQARRDCWSNDPCCARQESVALA
jgi:hypothetical protein